VDRVIRLDVEYDGTQFHGFSPQPRQRTIGGELEQALERLTGARPALTPAGRTDAGVHASGQVVSFRTASPVSVEVIKRATNAIVGRDLLVREAQEAPPGFDARRSARARRYEYLIWTRPDRSVRDWRWSLHLPEALDLEEMNRACAALVGEHDFAAFRTHAAQDDEAQSTVRRVSYCRWIAAEPAVGFVRMEIEADAFLRHMVRVIAGSALLIGQGKLPGSAMAEMVEKRDRAAAGPTAPAHGLTLVGVSY